MSFYKSMNFRDYLIAGRRVRLWGDVDKVVQMAVRSFQPFVAGDVVDKPLLEIDISTDIAFDKTKYTLLTQFDLEDDLGVCSFWSDDEGYALVMENGRDSVLFVCDKEVERVCSNIKPSLSMDYISFVRFGLWFVINMAFVLDGCSAVHSSTVVCRGGAVMFLGESGTGKSTHTRLWLENISGAELLNDDSPFVACDDEGVKVYGSPWSGKTSCYKNECYPLRAVVRLSQAPYNKIRPLHKLQAIGALLPSLPPAFVYDKRLEDALLSVLSQVLAKVSVYHLECLPDADAAQLSFNTIFGDDVKY